MQRLFRSVLVTAGLAAAGAAGAAPTPSSPKAIRFVEDDYAKALAEARSRRLPLFIEAWAPW